MKFKENLSPKPSLGSHLKVDIMLSLNAFKTFQVIDKMIPFQVKVQATTSPVKLVTTTTTTLTVVVATVGATRIMGIPLRLPVRQTQLRPQHLPSPTHLSSSHRHRPCVLSPPLCGAHPDTSLWTLINTLPCYVTACMVHTHPLHIPTLVTSLCLLLLLEPSHPLLTRLIRRQQYTSRLECIFQLQQSGLYSSHNSFRLDFICIHFSHT